MPAKASGGVVAVVGVNRSMIEAAEYVRHGWVLVRIPGRRKGPTTPGWNERQNCVHSADAAERISGGNVGLAHAYSGTCAIDIDDYEAAKIGFGSIGIELDALLSADDAVQISSGRENRAKLLYRLPEGVNPLPQAHLFGTAVDLRCATADGLTVQDVLPPSIHPDTGKPYRWAGMGDWKSLPELPEPILRIWRKELARRSPSSAPSTKVAGFEPIPIAAISIRPHTRRLIVEGMVDGQYQSRSEAIFGAMKDLVRAGVDDAAICRILADPAHKISEKALESHKGDIQAAMQWLAPQVAKARASVPPSEAHRSGQPIRRPATEPPRTSEPDSAGLNKSTAADLLQTAILRMRAEGNPGLVITSDCVRAWEYLHQNSADEYESLRAEAKKGGARVGEIDRLAIPKKERGRPRANPGPATDAARMAGGDGDEGDWTSSLIRHYNADGTVKTPCRVHNIVQILIHGDEFKGRVKRNDFSGLVELDGQCLTDGAFTGLKTTLERAWITEKVATSDLREALAGVGEHVRCHPIREYLEGLQWDGTTRIDTFSSDFLGTQQDAYHRGAFVAFFLSSIERVYRPGGKVDVMVILEGPQGVRKSTLWEVLGGQWYRDITDDINSKDFQLALQGVWIADLGELDQFNKAESSRVKSIITVKTDHLRRPYAQFHQDMPRQTVLVGGSNRSDWLSDPTGGRRFLPVSVKVDSIPVELISSMRDQLWAEAFHRYRAGNESWWDVLGAEEHQAARYVGDPWHGPIEEWLIGRSLVTSHQILSDCLRIELARQTRSDQIRVGNIMVQLKDWTKKNVYFPETGKQRWAYVRVERA